MLNRDYVFIAIRKNLTDVDDIRKELKISKKRAEEIAAVVRFIKQSHDESTNDLHIEGAVRIGLLSDIHFPYHDDAALDVACNFLKSRGIDILILNGDIVDFYSCSSYERHPSRRNIGLERDLALAGFSTLRKLFPDVRIIYREGNHEERFTRWLWSHATELFDAEEMQIENFLRLKDFGIEYVKGRSKIVVGKLNIYHGHELRSAATINIAISVLRKTFHNTLVGHWHQRQSVLKRVDDQAIGCWVVGCLCKLDPYYARVNDWIHGFALIEVQSNGNFVVSNFGILGKQIFL